jgi:hypothetical protein
MKGVCEELQDFANKYQMYLMEKGTGGGCRPLNWAVTMSRRIQVLDRAKELARKMKCFFPKTLRPAYLVLA